ncbi:hypothetical protein COW36_08045 [bacterium (Candidatus Blackallbacteria) CG17_big_fil_post_rev_8_21_14_2_50_48_46]|uniref:Uncharacterized protein n=1 Tax=bacterium (Candidatus Blackallbacteria) CG17_big_fil_post_rev_8_21_14_2_50_48_46 TaxID=2014261 RepID=A0A2M7G5X1_9BACT|nr:MAG: hypothetical protein COW64_24585 [bacterium (Candidatus Blackallbacteria) CG18_big_fil_WC_8_21_14_2_50_49_26]PIW17440.1 MAG: hypothetical protein COW36_08045 [bacterium (Candidatus Blackallbacteria) CG17_big_fil_post_rev_8_21_14_2_50_48_46]PIW48294.1 MAG: hypothetical protein COW20_09400 [bacterium (Candidatus Blackallbacteria) CG13_big_fil_rev_8_21_14_2_50_49_14]
MGNLSVQNNQPILPIQQSPKAAPAQPAAPAAEKAAISKDSLEWKNIPSSERVKTAITTTFKQTIIPYTVGGALAAPAAGAVLGGFIGLFSGNAGKFAVEGAKVGARFMPHGAAAGAVISGVDAAVVGTVVGTSPDKQSAMLRLGTLSAVVGILSADDKWDMLGAGVGAAAESVRAGRIFEKTNEALQAH